MTALRERPTLAQAVAVRGQLASGLIAYYDTLIERLDRTPWSHDDGLVRATDVAVPIRVYKQVTDADKRRRQDEERRPSDLDPELVALYEQPTRGGEIVDWSREQRRVNRAVILGGPGSGKSMLTQIAALGLAQSARDDLKAQRREVDQVPLVVHLPLPALAQPGLPAGLGEAVLALLQQPDYGKLAPTAAGYVAARLAHPQTWLILDGLDEVDPNHRPSLDARLRQADTQRWHSRLLLTCRPADYERGHLPWRQLTEYELAPLRLPQEGRQLVAKWFGVGDPAGRSLLATIQASAGLRQAAGSPLLLTLMCVAHEEQPLPAGLRRADLYGRVLRSPRRRAWKADHEQPNDRHVDDLVRLLVEVAWARFQARPNANLFGNDEIIAAIAAAPTAPLPRAIQTALAQGGFAPNLLVYAPALLRDELRHPGVLVDAGRAADGAGQLAFLHRSVYEYLAAAALAKQAATTGWDAVWALVESHLWSPAWQQTIALLAGCLADPDPLIASLLACGDADPIHQRHLLAAACIGEAGAERVDPATAQAVANYLALVLRSAAYIDHQLAARGLVHLGKPGLPPLVAALADQDSDVSGAVAVALGQFGDAAAISHLAHALTYTDDDLRQTVAFTLGSRGDPTALSVLTRAFTDPYVMVRYNAVCGLRLLSDPAALPLLTHALSDQDAKVRSAAAEALGELGDPAALPLLTHALSDSDEWVRFHVAEALRKLGDSVALTHALSDHYADTDVRVTVVPALDRVVHSAALPHLVHTLAAPNAFPGGARSAAAEALGELGDPAALPHLTHALDDQDEWVRFAAAKSLCRLGDPAALPHLVNVLTDTNVHMRRSAAAFLTRFLTSGMAHDLAAVLLDQWTTFGDHRSEVYLLLWRLAWRLESVAPLQPIAQAATDYVLALGLTETAEYRDRAIALLRRLANQFPDDAVVADQLAKLTDAPPPPDA